LRAIIKTDDSYVDTELLQSLTANLFYFRVELRGGNDGMTKLVALCGQLATDESGAPGNQYLHVDSPSGADRKL
jgi:hypothetical protein